MTGSDRFDDEPRSVIIVGAGIVGLSTAWFLQERGVDVTVVDRVGVAAGASSGNAGWIAPGLTFPLNSPEVLRYGLSALRDPTAPRHLQLTADTRFGAFFTQFAAHCRSSAWKQALRANAVLNEDCIEAFDVLLANGVDVPVTDAPITAVFRGTEKADRMLANLHELEKAGQPMYVTGLAGAALREQVPLASSAITAGIDVNAQRFVDPRRFVEALSRCVMRRGATIHRREIRQIRRSGNGVAVYPRGGRPLTADAAVIATGARLPQLAARWLLAPVHTGYGYSFTVPVDRPVPNPIYLPEARAACTPYRGALRVSGTTALFCDQRGPTMAQRMEVTALLRPLLDGVRWAELSDVWVGAYSVTPDGRALIGEVSPRIYLAGGHGMWGFTQGPVTGRLLTEQITTGKRPEMLTQFDPLRRRGGRRTTGREPALSRSLAR